MTNQYYTKTGNPITESRGLSNLVRDEYALVEQGFDKLPTPAQVWGASANYLVDSGSANAYVVSFPSNVSTLTDGLTLTIKTQNPNTGASTLNVGGGGAKQITRPDGTQLVANDIINVFRVTYNTTTATWLFLDQSTAAADSGLPTTGGTMTGPINEAKGANIASASTINLQTATGNYVHITGTTTINSITLDAGAERVVVFDNLLTLTYSSNLILPGGTDIVTSAGDVAFFRGEGSGIVRCESYVRADGYALKDNEVVLNVFSVTACAIDVGISIPSGYSEVDIKVKDLLVNCANNGIFFLQMNGQTAGINYTYQYDGAHSYNQSASTNTPTTDLGAKRQQTAMYPFEQLQVGTAQGQGVNLTITLFNASANVYKDLAGSGHGGAIVYTADAGGPFTSVYLQRTNFVGYMLSTAKCTALNLRSLAGSGFKFMGGTITLVGRKR